MPASHPSLYTDPEEVAAWRSLEAAEQALESALKRTPGCTPEICGLVYYLAADSRLLSAPALSDGTPDLENAVHRSEYEGLGADGMNQISAEIQSWLAVTMAAALRQ